MGSSASSAGRSDGGNTPGAPEGAGDTLIGKTVGSYRVLKVLGEGGMGCVYLGEHSMIGRKAAIKVLGADVAGSEEIVSRFFVEARAVNDIRHPNIVEVTDFGTLGSQPFIVMEYLEGETLADRMERIGALDQATGVRIASQIASALGAAHAQGLVHRDLKPANIFLRQHPDYPDFVKVLDFGIAKLLGVGATGKAEHHTLVGSVLGTPAYMSPEQCLGDLNLDHRSDIYSLGILLYAMVVGRLPYEGQALGRFILGHVHEPPPRPESLNPQVTPGMSAVILRALQKKPEQRFQNMRDVREALALLVAGGAAAPVTPPPMIIDRPSDRAWAPVAITGGVTPPPRHLPPPGTPAAGIANAPTTSRWDASAPTSVGQGAMLSPDTLRERLVDIVRGKVISGELALPALPAATQHCLELLRDPAAFSFAAAASVLAKEPRISGAIVQRANSPTFAGRSFANNLEKAVARLGAQGLRVALYEQAVRPVLQPRHPRIEDAFRRGWHHALGMALVAERLVDGRPSDAMASPDGFLGGLFADAGRPIVAQLLVDIERQLGAKSGRRWMNDDLLFRCVEATHGPIGAALARRWGLPEPIAAAVESAVESAADRWGEKWSFDETLRLARVLAAREGYYMRADEVPRVAPRLDAARRAFRLDDAFLTRAVQGLKERVLRHT